MKGAKAAPKSVKSSKGTITKGKGKGKPTGGTSAQSKATMGYCAGEDEAVCVCTVREKVKSIASLKFQFAKSSTLVPYMEKAALSASVACDVREALEGGSDLSTASITAAVVEGIEKALRIEHCVSVEDLTYGVVAGVKSVLVEKEVKEEVVDSVCKGIEEGVKGVEMVAGDVSGRFIFGTKYLGGMPGYMPAPMYMPGFMPGFMPGYMPGMPFQGFPGFPGVAPVAP